MVKPIKTDTVNEMVGLIRDAKSVILNDFTGLNVADISELRKECRKNGVTFRVIKNTLAKISFADLGIEGMEPLLEGPTAFAISLTDEVSPAQVLKKFADENDLPKFKGGYVAGRVIDKDEVVRLAVLPGREVLLTQVVGTIQAPLRGLVGVLSASLRDLAGVLNAISEKKGAA
ncbi:MAG: 50S ribosomal protein L10 [Candidatus Krumholzibacteriota bacterium]|nr:50S ribosomal protein L10 [Candidatus Krumholzibacteriota bacterium]